MEIQTAGFWGPLFGFLASVFLFGRALVKYYADRKEKSDAKKANLDASNLRLKKHFDEETLEGYSQTLEGLRSLVGLMVPILERHTDQLKGLTARLEDSKKSNELVTKAQKLLGEMLIDTRDVARQMKVYFDTHQADRAHDRQAARAILGRIDAIETEVVELKKGWVLVRGKKTGG